MCCTQAPWSPTLCPTASIDYQACVYPDVKSLYSGHNWVFWAVLQSLASLAMFTDGHVFHANGIFANIYLLQGKQTDNNPKMAAKLEWEELKRTKNPGKHLRAGYLRFLLSIVLTAYSCRVSMYKLNFDLYNWVLYTFSFLVRLPFQLRNACQ